jgi:hypothetical protein
MSMRLINTTTFAAEFVSVAAGAKEYAILSHTWGPEGLCFQELLAIEQDATHRSAAKAGYLKLQGACRKARSAGIDHIWIDTCCIDKTSSTELSEAINSMYRWYKEALVCFVYLEDIEASGEVVNPGLEHCRWFTRGWCLQELIAPEVVEFCDKRWMTIGSKATMADEIAKITRICSEILLDSSLVASVPVAQRMSWAAGRKTTRKEDEAYCLLGIFGIAMPMLYGEGSQAFRRLQEHIITKSNDMSILATGSFLQGGERVLFEGLFADTPEDFHNCGSVAHIPGHVVYNPAFTLTNRGLLFRHLELGLHRGDAMYSLRLNCNTADGEEARIYLRKVGPALYAKSANLPSESDYYPPKIQLEEAYVLVDISDFSHEQLERYLQHVIQVKSNTHDLSEALHVVERFPQSNRWDPSGMQYLTQGTSEFKGCCKLFLGLAWSWNRSEALPMKGHVYVACGLYRLREGAYFLWTKLFTPAQWEKLEDTVGFSKVWHNVGPTDTIKSGELQITATIPISKSTRDICVCDLTVDIKLKSPVAQIS